MLNSRQPYLYRARVFWSCRGLLLAADDTDEADAHPGHPRDPRLLSLRLHRLEFFKFLEFLSKLAPNFLAAGHDDADRFIDGAMQHDEMRLLTMCKSAFPVFSHYCCLLQNVAQMIRRPAGFGGFPCWRMRSTLDVEYRLASVSDLVHPYNCSIQNSCNRSFPLNR
jgi:hypothetical protein